MKSVKLDFSNRIVSMVSDQKTVIAYMDPELREKDFQTFFPEEMPYEHAEYVTFDFENGVICLNRMHKPFGSSREFNEKTGYVKRIPMPAISDKCQNILEAAGWNP